MSRFKAFYQRLLALTHKSFLVSILRKPIGFVFLCYACPLAILAVVLSIPDFTSSSNVYGISSPAPIKSLADVIDKKLVIVRPSYLGSDVDRVIDTFTKGIDSSLLQFEKDDGILATECLANLHGVSPCFAAAIFVDSPETTEKVPSVNKMTENNKQGHVWSYALQFDPSRFRGHFDANNHDNTADKYQLPLQLAINQAITNSTSVPQSVPFTTETQEENERAHDMDSVYLLSNYYMFALFACYLFIIYRHTALYTAERESGMAQLIDSMGGGSAATTRVLSWLAIFNLSCLPVFIVFGVLCWYILFPATDVGTNIGWQILSGFAVNSSTVFAASFFRKSRVSAIYVIGAFLLTAVGAQVFALQIPGEGPAGAYVLSLLFVGSNYIFFVVQMCLWELKGTPPDLTVQPPSPSGQSLQCTTYEITQAEMLGFLAVQIIVYPLLAILVEKLMHGIDFRSRTFATGEDEKSTAVAETVDLHKTFEPSIWAKIFCCGRRKATHAVNGVSLKSHRGQILCLVGPNGSGKTTTLHMMAGFLKPTSGTVHLGAIPSQIGICPQRNTLWEDLTVEEHVRIWRNIKGGDHESNEDLAQLIGSCDLDAKRKSKAKTLSGGQKRKLQLSCMFVGGSTVCLIDECTSGLDPLSRRVIWEILMEQRAKRSIVFTTHFLDEVDVLADHIVILTKGRVNNAGAAAKLKSLHGGGYRVTAPLGASTGGISHDYPSAVHQDRIVYTTPDSTSAVALCRGFSAAGVQDIGIVGPQFEDVFLRLADDEGVLQLSDSIEPSDKAQAFELEVAQPMSFSQQLWVLFRKRVTILKRFWFPYFWVVALPLIITPFLDSILTGGTTPYTLPSCENLEFISGVPYGDALYFSDYCTKDPEYCDQVILGPPSANETLYKQVQEKWNDVFDVDESGYYLLTVVENTAQQVIDQVKAAREKAPYGLYGIYMGSESEDPLIAFALDTYESNPLVLSLFSEMESGIQIVMGQDQFAQEEAAALGTGTIYAVFFTLIQTIWPAAFVLYPAIEKSRKVRALEYANGVRRGPLWLAYGLFDAIFALVIALATSLILQFTMDAWVGSPMVMFPILFLYGIAAILMGYVISHFVTGSLKAFLSMAGISLIMYAVAAIAFAVGSGYSSAGEMSDISEGLTFGLNLILPIGNVWRACLVGLNVGEVACSDGSLVWAGSIYAYGGPILYLCIQVAFLLVVIVWIEGDLALFRRKPGQKSIWKFWKRKSSKTSSDAILLESRDGAQTSEPNMRAAAAEWKDSEKGTVVRSAEVEAEAARVEQARDDFLRILNVDRSFGSNHAVQNVSFGLPQNDVLALLGPNGAGKSTLVNMIQSELSPDHGHLYLRGEDARTRSAQRNLGVCPQFDALDLMTTEEHLTFYARVKGIKDIKGNVDHIMYRLGLTPHAQKVATKLSGGNKRKLSLAIALMGSPAVMVLDEPTSAMDAVAKRSFWRLIQEVTPGRSVLLTTHSMEEADTLATRAAIIAKRLLTVGTTQSLREKYSNLSYVSLLLSSAPDSTEEMARVRSWVSENIPGAELERVMLGGQIRFTVPGATEGGQSHVPDLIELLESEKDAMGIDYYSIGGATLESVFLSVARENNAQEEDGAAHRSIWKRMLRQ